MNRQVKQILALSLFAAACTGVGMGLSYRWVAQAQEDKPVVVDPKGLDRMPPIAEVAEKLNPTVVSITNTSIVKGRRGPDMGGDGLFEFFFGPGGQGGRRNPSREEEQKVQGFGSGVIISSNGEILTNRHVVEGARGGDADTLEVKMADGRTFKAKVLGKDKEVDVALLKIEASHLPYAVLGDSDKARVGEWVVAIGNPLGLEHTVTQGIISAKGRSGRAIGDGPGLESYLQTDAAINRGNSGGPLLNLRGEVIGINTAINPMGQNIGFSVPSNLISRILKDLRAGRPVSRGYLGVAPVELDGGFQDVLGVKQGVVVSEVTKGQAAEKAGLQKLDVIVSVEGQAVKSPEDLIQAIAGRRAGEMVKLSIVRDGKSKEVTVQLGARPANPNEPGEENEGERTPEDTEKSGKLDLLKGYGFNVEALSPGLRQLYGIPASAKGVVITEVATRAEASDKVRQGMLITGVGRKDISNLQEFRSEVKRMEGKTLLLQVAQFDRNGREVSRYVSIPPR